MQKVVNFFCEWVKYNYKTVTWITLQDNEHAMLECFRACGQIRKAWEEA